ncbi:MAG: alpha/beta hydrolase [Bacteroidales bacterium]|nr:alpha/beta hydrolase [Bacteroidales bacterium]
MRRLVTIFIALALMAAGLRAQPVSGSWHGELNLGTSKLAIVFHFEDGRCTMDSPDQGAFDIPAVVEFISADSVSVSQKDMDAKYRGRLKDGIIRGRFSQRGLSLPLDLTPGTIEYSRPQSPAGPFLYKSEEVAFSNGDASLSGTLTYPEGWNGKKKIPVAIMVSGSGLQNRDEELFGHKPFLVIADYLARRGIATLRYDDRGTGASKGDASGATTEDFMEDAVSGLNLLKGKKKFSKVGVIGHSEGGGIAFMLASRGQVDFLVSLAGPGVQGDSILLLQNINALRKAGFPMTPTKEQIRESIKAQNNPWLDFFIDYDPASDIRRILVPALILNGEKDTQVEAAVNIPAIEENLPRGGRGKFVARKTEIKVYPDLNHLFQHCTTGQSEEYKQIEETISEEVLSDIAAWIRKL